MQGFSSNLFCSFKHLVFKYRLGFTYYFTFLDIYDLNGPDEQEESETPTIPEWNDLESSELNKSVVSSHRQSKQLGVWGERRKVWNESKCCEEALA